MGEKYGRRMGRKDGEERWGRIGRKGGGEVGRKGGVKIREGSTCISSCWSLFIYSGTCDFGGRPVAMPANMG